jgi:hypothetical protein
MTPEQRELLQQIETAFRDTQLGDGVSLRQTVVLDDYGSEAELQAARAQDELHDWRKIIDDPELVRHISFGGLSFYDAAGLCFHLPAYLSVAVKDPHQGIVANLVYSLTHIDEIEGYNRQRFAPLTPAQRACVREVLNYLRPYWCDYVGIDNAINGNWSE